MTVNVLTTDSIGSSRV